jgi:DNA-directed RNA polymerase specialized sigma24 family protein
MILRSLLSPILQKKPLPGFSETLPQLYRFCFLMTRDADKAREAFQSTVREAAFRSSHGELPNDRLWFFAESRRRCLYAMKDDAQPEPAPLAEEVLSTDASARIAQLEPAQLATWISAVPEPQRSALALFYLNEFTYREILSLLDLKVNELATLIAGGRSLFQAWLKTTTDAQ